MTLSGTGQFGATSWSISKNWMRSSAGLNFRGRGAETMEPKESSSISDSALSYTDVLLPSESSSTFCQLKKKYVLSFINNCRKRC